jgi:hypothetical protein
MRAHVLQNYPTKDRAGATGFTIESFDGLKKKLLFDARRAAFEIDAARRVRLGVRK